MTSTELADIGSLDDLDHRLQQIGMTARWNRPASCVIDLERRSQAKVPSTQQSLTAFGSMLLRHASQTRLAVEAQMAMEIDGENRTVCRKFGMGPESVSHVECIHELTEIRKRHEQRIASEAIGAL